MLKVSIVTISFNQAQFLERTIESVLSQNYPELEYIVVDPGSSDGSRELIERYGKRIAKTIFEPDRGAADGLNNGFRVATGDVLGFLNSDDILYPGAVSAAVRYLEKHPEIDVVSGHARIIDANDRVLRLCYSDRMSIRKCAYDSISIMQPSTFFRRSAFDRTAGFNVENRVIWDGEFFFDLANAGCSFGLYGDIWSGYRLHPVSITTSWTSDQKGKRDEVVRRIFYKAVGRNPNRLDKAITFALRVWKHLENPRDTFERVLRGPVLKRNLD